MDLTKDSLEKIKSKILLYKSDRMIKEPDVSQLLFDLTKQGDIETVFDWQRLCLNLLSLLSNPIVSQQLEEYYKDKAGAMLKSLYSFFWCINTNDKEFKPYLDLLKLHFWRSIEDVQDDLVEMDEYYSGKLKKRCLCNEQ